MIGLDETTLGVKKGKRFVKGKAQGCPYFGQGGFLTVGGPNESDAQGEDNEAPGEESIATPEEGAEKCPFRSASGLQCPHGAANFLEKEARDSPDPDLWREMGGNDEEEPDLSPEEMHDGVIRKCNQKVHEVLDAHLTRFIAEAEKCADLDSIDLDQRVDECCRDVEDEFENGIVAVISELLRGLPCPCAMTDMNGLILHWNLAAAEEFQWSPEEMRNANIKILVADADTRRKHDSYIRRYNQTNKSRLVGYPGRPTRKLLGRRKDGTEIWVRLGVSVINCKIVRLFIATMSNVDDIFKRHEKNVRDGDQYEAMMAQFLSMFSGMYDAMTELSDDGIVLSHSSGLNDIFRRNMLGEKPLEFIEEGAPWYKDLVSEYQASAPNSTVPAVKKKVSFRLNREVIVVNLAAFPSGLKSRGRTIVRMGIEVLERDVPLETLPVASERLMNLTSNVLQGCEDYLPERTDLSDLATRETSQSVSVINEDPEETDHQKGDTISDLATKETPPPLSLTNENPDAIVHLTSNMISDLSELRFPIDATYCHESNPSYMTLPVDEFFHDPKFNRRPKDIELMNESHFPAVYPNYGSLGHPEFCELPCNRTRWINGKCADGNNCHFCHLPHQFCGRFDKRDRNFLDDISCAEKLLLMERVVLEKAKLVPVKLVLLKEIFDSLRQIIGEIEHEGLLKSEKEGKRGQGERIIARFKKMNLRSSLSIFTRLCRDLDRGSEIIPLIDSIRKLYCCPPPPSSPTRKSLKNKEENSTV